MPDGTRTTHSFHYGKKAELPGGGRSVTYRVQLSGNLHSTWTDQFEVGGVDDVILCAHCLTGARIRRAWADLLHKWFLQPLATVAYVLWATGVIVLTLQANWSQTVLWLGAGLLVTVTAYAAIYPTLQLEDFAWRMAVDLHEEHLRDEGWEVFWTDSELIRPDSAPIRLRSSAHR